MKKLLLIGTLFLSVQANAETAITIYSKNQPGYNHNASQGYAVVRETRKVNLPKANTTLKYRDIAEKIDATTVQFKSLTDPLGTKVAEQNYQFDLVSQDKLLQKYIDKKVTIENKVGDSIEQITGTLLSAQGGITLKADSGEVLTFTGRPNMKFAELPGGLITKPTLVWDIFTKKPGQHKTEVSYQTKGITWWADYNLTFKPDAKDENKGHVDFNSWVSILNQSGGSYNKAKLKLMAGDVQRVQPQQNHRYAKASLDYVVAESAAAPGFSEKSFFEYHLYTLSRPATIPNNSTKQLELIPKAVSVPVEKLLVYEASQRYYGGHNTNRNFGAVGNKKVDVYLKLENKKEKGLGKPLPAGRIRVNQSDSDGSLEFIGEDKIGHTARNEDILLKLGSAFDVVGERKQVNYSYDSKRKIIEEEYEVKIRNQKDKNAVKVLVKENLGRAANWKIIDSSHKYTKENSNTIHFEVNPAAEKEAVITYKVKYWW